MPRCVDCENYQPTNGESSCKLAHNTSYPEVSYLCSGFEPKKQSEQKEKQKKFGHPAFYKLLDQMAELHSRKNHDYAGTKDPLKNLRASMRLDIDPVTAVLVRLQDKWSRLEEFVKSGQLLVKDESVEDTLMDNAIYSLLAIILRREQQNKNGVEKEK